MVRAAEYTVPDRGGQDSELITVITTILDPAALTAAEMAFAYHRRREHESGLDEIKTHLRAAGGSSAPSPLTWSSRRCGGSCWPTTRSGN